MRPRWHKVLADLFSHKIRSLLVIASIAVGLFAIGMNMTVYVILSEDIRSGYKAVHPANIQVRAAQFDADFVQRINHLPVIDKAQGAWNMNLRLRTANSEWKPISIKALMLEDMQEQSINQVMLVQGSWPPAEKEIVLEVNKLADTGASLGDELEIKLPSGTIRKLRLVGVVQDQTLGSSSGEGGFFLAPIQGYVTTGSLDWLEQPDVFNTLYVTAKQGQEDRQALHAVADQILKEFDQHGYIATSSVVRLSDEHPNLAYVDAMTAVVFALGFLVVFLSGFLITNTLSALLNQQVEQIGVMKTVGASRRQIIGVYMVLILVFSLIALAIAIPPSNQASYALLKYLSNRINFQLQGFRPVSASIILQTLVALLVPQIAGSLPILQGTRISVREALSGTTIAQVDDTGPIYRWLAKVRGLSRPLLISLRNTFRRRGRLLLTLATLTLGGAIFVATFNVRFSIEKYIDQLGHYFLADVNVSFSQPYRMSRVKQDLLQVPGVKSVEGWSGAVAQVVQEDGTPGESLQIVAPPANSYLVEPILASGRWIKPGDENAIALSEVFHSHFPDLKVGDTIRLKVGLDESDWVVVGFFQLAGRSTGLMAYANYDYVAKLTGRYGSATLFRVVATGKDLTLEQQKELAHRVEIYLGGLGYEISEVTAGLWLQETTSKGLNVLTTFLLIMSLLMASVGSIGLMGTMSLNVMERTREIGVMRAIGGSDRAIISIVLVEGVLIGLISWLLACLVAVPISKQLADVIFRIIFNTNARLAFNFSGNLIWLGLVLLLSIIASLIPAYNASRLTIREVLAYE